MTLAHWTDRLTLMAVSHTCDLTPADARGLLALLAELRDDRITAEASAATHARDRAELEQALGEACAHRLEAERMLAAVERCGRAVDGQRCVLHIGHSANHVHGPVAHAGSPTEVESEEAWVLATQAEHALLGPTSTGTHLTAEGGTPRGPELDAEVG
jgi:hypothetical protein